MFKSLREWLKRLNPSYQDRMYAYLSQANDRVHLEQLEKEWFTKYGRKF
jgi:hypothetical protein